MDWTAAIVGAEQWAAERAAHACAAGSGPMRAARWQASHSPWPRHPPHFLQAIAALPPVEAQM